jgi:hypothetical protein
MGATGSTRRGLGSRLVLALLGLSALAGCGGTASPTAGGTSLAAGSPAARLTINVHGSTITPSPATVNVAAGQPVQLVLTADHNSEVHVHAASIKQPITAGVPLTFTFTPSQQRVYEVEMHHPHLLLVKIAAR